MRVFRETHDEPLAVKMAGVKIGDRLLALGCSDPPLVARLAAKTGLTGRACAVDDSDRRTSHAAEVIAREGALVETFTAPFTMLPLDDESFDVAVVRDVLPKLPADQRVGCVLEVLRVLRPGGRCLVIEAARRSGLGALLTRRSADPSYLAGGAAPSALEAAGFRAVRTLAERAGLVFVEGVKGTS